MRTGVNHQELQWLQFRWSHSEDGKGRPTRTGAEENKLKKNGWTAELETGISTLDQGNQALLTLINRVIEASEGTDETVLQASLRDLQTQTVAHFEHEERLMAECRYEAASQHQADHQQLLAEIQYQIDDLEAGSAGVAEIARFMRNWLLQHIVSQDIPFGNAVLTQGGTTDRRKSSDDTDPGEEQYDIFEERRLGSLEPIEWTEKLAVGNEAIDAGHRALCASLNSILAARKSAGKERLGMLLVNLCDATAAHFYAEEKLMSRFNYQDTVAHKEEHTKLLEEIADLVDDWRDNQISTDLLCRFLHRWLLRHIAGSDIPMCKAIDQSAAGA